MLLAVKSGFCQEYNKYSKQTKFILYVSTSFDCSHTLEKKTFLSIN